MARDGDPIDFAKQQLLRYRDLLANFSRRNKELYFRPGKASSLSLSVDLPPKPPAQDGAKEALDLVASGAAASAAQAEQAAELGACVEFVFSPLTMSSQEAKSLLGSLKLDLTDHFGLFERPNRTVESRLEKIRSADTRYQKEFGISGAWLLGPFLLWRESATHQPSELLISPLFKLPVDLKRSKQRRWELVIEDGALRINPSLQLALSKRIGVSVPDEYESETFESAASEVASRIAVDGRQVSVASATGRFSRLANGAPVIDPASVALPSARIEEALKNIAAGLNGEVKRRAPELPRILGKSKQIHDEDGNVVGQRPTTIEQDLSEGERAYYEAVTFDHFLIVDAFYVDHLSATRMPLFRDYEQVLDSLAAHPVIAELLGHGPLPAGGERAKAPRELDSYTERENYFVIATDSSQHGAIELASKGSAIVIQGPPGTGKSQTIANLIADKIATGKKILFVAEKRAALDVVFTRLKQARIDQQAVLIHSSEVDKKELYASFLQLADSTPKEEDRAGWERVAIRLDRAKTEIHGYYDVAMSKFRNTGLTVSEVLALHAAHSTPGDSDDDVRLGRIFAASTTAGDLDELSTELDQLQDLMRNLQDFEQHPWKDKNPDLVITAEVKSRFEVACSRVAKASKDLEDCDNKARSAFPGLRIATLSRAFISVFGTSEEQASSQPDDMELYSLVAHFSPSRVDGVDSIGKIDCIEKSLVELFGELEGSWPLARDFRPDADLSLVDQMEDYFKVPRSVLAPLSQCFWRSRRICLSLMTVEGSKGMRLSRLDERPFKAFKAHSKARDSMIALLADAGEALGAQAESSPWDVLAAHVQRRVGLLNKARQFISAVRALEDGGSKVIDCSSPIVVEKLSGRMRDLCKTLSERDSICSDVESALADVDSLFVRSEGWQIDAPSECLRRLEKLRATLSDCEAIESVERFCLRIGERRGVNGFRQEGLPLLLSRKNSWGKRVAKEISRLWYDEVRTSHIQVRGFDSK